MKANYTDITVVLDRSGSMQSIATDTIGGFNKFLEDQKRAPGEATITLNQFDHEFERVLSGEKIESAQPLTSRSYIPRGYTALHDAIGRSINDTGTRLSAMPEGDRPEKVIVVIITDGLENASREFNGNIIKSMINEQREKWNWEFVFLGANQDAVTVAQSMGVSPGNAMTYAANSIGASAAFQATSANMVSLRSGQKRSMAYSEADRLEQKKAGA